MEPQPRAGSPLAANSAQHNVIEDMTAGHTGDDHRSVARRLVKSDLSPRTRGQVELSDRSEEDRVEDDQNGEDGVDSDEAGRAGDIPPMIHSRTNISDLGFEILDTIFSYFSNPPSATPESGHSHYENQQNLLAFCQVNKAFYRVARLHLSRYIPIASTFKARQVLSLCRDQDGQTSLLPNDSFGSRVHSLSLIWPDQGKYSTRRTSVITEYEFHSLLSSFTSLRSLELICLPYFNRLNPLTIATISSLSSLDNLRSLSFNGSPFLLSQKEEYGIVNSLLLLVPKLEHLSIINMPLNSLIDCLSEDTPRPTFRLKSLTIKISSARMLKPEVLEWLLESSSQYQTCQELTIWLSKKCTDRFNEYSESISSIKDNEGFYKLEEPLSKLSPSLRKLSIMGLRTGQASSILSKTSENLEVLKIFDTFGYGNDSSIINDFPLPSGLERLEILPNPSIAFGAIPPPFEPIITGPSMSNGNGRGRNSGAGASSNTNSTSSSGTSRQRGHEATTSSNTASSSSQADLPTISTTSSTTNSTGEINDNSPATPHTFTEIPISSSSFIAELGKGNRLEKLKIVKVPHNARFGKRGKWNNKELSKACRKFGVVIEEI